MDEPGVPETKSTQGQETAGAEDGLEEYERFSSEDSNILSWILHSQPLLSLLSPPVSLELFIEDLKPEDHDEGAAGDHEDHVEEEMSVVVVSDTVIEPRTVVVHVEDAGITDTENEVS